jgi:hypothetical protein
MGTFQSLVSVMLVHENIVYTQEFSTVREVHDLSPVGGLDVLFWPVGLAGARAKACIFAKWSFSRELCESTPTAPIFSNERNVQLETSNCVLLPFIE